METNAMAGPMSIYRHRPTAIVVLAVLNFVFAGLGILSVLCGAILFWVTMAIVTAINMVSVPATGEQTSAALQSIPGFVPYMIASSLLDTIMALLIAIAGFGLLSMRPWARWLSVVYGIYTILASLFGIIYTLTVINPTIQSWQVELARRQGTAPPPASAGDVTRLALPVCAIAYGVALLVVLFLPHVSAAFAGKDYPPGEHFPAPADAPANWAGGDRHGGEAFQSGDPRWGPRG
jgi:hypothetical protein